MKISVKQLSEALSKLPDPNRWPLPFVRVHIMEYEERPLEMNIDSDRASFKILEFKKSFRDWTIEL